MKVGYSHSLVPVQGIRKMRAAGNLAARALMYGGSLVRPGMTTDEIDKAMHKWVLCGCCVGAVWVLCGSGGSNANACASFNA